MHGVIKVFDAKTYIEFVSNFISVGAKTVPRGKVKGLAEYLRCHPSFLSQILRGKAHMSHEQAIRFCLYSQLSEEESEFFVNLLNRDRAGDLQTTTHFEKIITRKLQERSSLKIRAGLDSTLSTEQEVLYFQSFIHPLVHAALHLPNITDPGKLSTVLDIPETEIRESLRLLQSLGLALKKSGQWRPTQTNLHVGKENPLNRAYHINWRLKTAAMLQEGRRTREHTHFTSVFCISKSDVERIREIVLNSLETIRREMAASESERLFTLCLDYFPID